MGWKTGEVTCNRDVDGALDTPLLLLPEAAVVALLGLLSPTLRPKES